MVVIWSSYWMSIVGVLEKNKYKFIFFKILMGVKYGVSFASPKYDLCSGFAIAVPIDHAIMRPWDLGTNYLADKLNISLLIDMTSSVLICSDTEKDKMVLLASYSSLKKLNTVTLLALKTKSCRDTKQICHHCHISVSLLLSKLTRNMPFASQYGFSPIR